MKKATILVVLALLASCRSLPQEDEIHDDVIPEEPKVSDFIKVTGVELDKAEVVIDEIGDTVRLYATVFPENATDKRVKWSRGTVTYSIDTTGLVTALDNGVGTITVTTVDQGKTARCSIKISQKVTDISLDYNYVCTPVGVQINLSTIVDPSNAGNSDCSWSCNPEDVVSLSPYYYYDSDSGYRRRPSVHMNGISVGKTTVIVASVSNSDVADTCEVEVYSPMEIEAVDMGLSVQWANANLGARSLEDIGDYYAWGETSPQYYTLTPQIWKYTWPRYPYDWEVYRWGSSPLSLYKYNTKERCGTVDNITELEAEDDAAHVILGGNWRIPTKEEWKELFDNSTITCISESGRNGYMVISAINGNSLFFPSTGFFKLLSESIENRYTGIEDSADGYYWSSLISEDSPYGAFAAHFSTPDLFSFSGLYRCWGCVIRPVMQP